jgi:hypothetical protein
LAQKLLPYRHNIDFQTVMHQSEIQLTSQIA